VDGVADGDAVLFQQPGQLLEAVLGLGHRQAIARHEHDPLGGLEGEGTLLGGCRR